MTTYLSLFSGAGGLEHPELSPLLVCERDAACGRVLRRKHPAASLHNDVMTLDAPHADFVVGGWPCQDISSAGHMTGLDGARSGLFFRMVEIAVNSGAHTLVGENVPNLLTVNKGRDFNRVVETLAASGFKYISWRTLNARQFGLPQERKRVFVVASKHREFAMSLHATEPSIQNDAVKSAPDAAGFYWTAGGRSICYARGYSPALKVGASDSKGRSAVAIFCGGTVRKLSADGCARLQGFDPADFAGESKTDIVRMAGNAVAVPMGQFVLAKVFDGREQPVQYIGTGMQLQFSRFQDDGIYEDGIVWGVKHQASALATNLDDVVADDDGEPLSGQAAAGLIVRTVRSGKSLPPDLFDTLLRQSDVRTSYRGSRSNSFEALDNIDVNTYRRALDQGLRMTSVSPTIERRQQDLFSS